MEAIQWSKATAQPITALLWFAAVWIKNLHPVFSMGPFVNQNQTIRPNAKVAVTDLHGQFRQINSLQILGTCIDNNEVVAKAFHFGELD